MTAMRGMIVSLVVVAFGTTAHAEVMPLRRAVLYSSGVGYFEHQGEVSGGATIELPFRTGQINDVLKSLVVLDPSGRAGSVNYGSADPLDKALSSFSIDVRPESLHALLGRARGASVEVEGPQSAKGAILGVEARTEKHDDTEVTRYILNLLTDKGLEAIELESVHAVRFTDPKLQDELRKALSLVAEARDADARPVEVRLEGDGQRDVRIGYLVESPVWKTSYRLDLSGDKPLLQGWAIVENTSDADWNDIELSLVSGRPISFVQDLFTPLYLQRPLVKPENYAFLQPRLYDEGIAAGMPAAPPSPMVMRKARSLEARVGQQLAADKFSAGATMEMDAAPSAVGLDAAMQAAAAADRVGEYFQFTIKEPVSIPRRRSAMLAILNQPVEAERISIYNASVLPKHPLAGAKLVNSTGLSLPAGPVTVFDGGAYAGDARIDDTTMGQERLLSFAVDTDVTVDPSVKTSQRVVAAKIVRGVLNLTRATEIRQAYAVRNKADRDKTLLIEHPFAPARELLEPNKPDEKTADLYRFKLDIAAGKSSELVVREQEKRSQTITLIDQPLPMLLELAREGQISKATRDALAKAAEMTQQLARLVEEISNAQKRMDRLRQDQDRVRANLRAVQSNSSLARRYTDKLTEQEDQIDQLGAHMLELDDQIQQQRDAMATYLSNLNVE